MEYLRLALVAVNSLAFLALLVMAVRLRSREKYPWIKRLWTIVALACGALILGSFQRVALQAVSVGWLPESVGANATSELQFTQALIVLALLIGAFITLKRLASSMEASERMSASLIDRVRHVDPRSLRLTTREGEVLALIGQGVTADSDLAAKLHISASTVQSHVKSLLKKTELNSRMDLVAVAVLVASSRDGR